MRRPGSASCFLIAAANRAEDDDSQQPAAVRAGDGEDDDRDRTADAAREQAAETRQRREHQSSRNPSRHSTGERRGVAGRFQTSITCRSLTAPVTVPEYTWLKKKRVSGWRLRNFLAASQLMWLKTSPGPVASTIAASAPWTSLSSGAVGSVSAE